MGKFCKIGAFLSLVTALHFISCERVEDYNKIYFLSKINSSSEFIDYYNFSINYEYNSEDKIYRITVAPWLEYQKWIKTHEYNQFGEIYKTQICYVIDNESNCLDPVYYEDNEPLLPLNSGTYELYETEIVEYDQNGNPTVIIEYYKYTYILSIIQYDDKINPNATLEVPFRFYPYLYPMNFVEVSRNNILSFDQTIYNYNGTKVGKTDNNYYSIFEYNIDNFPLQEKRYYNSGNIVLNFEYNVKYHILN